MGRSKQLLEVNGTTLLNNAIREAIQLPDSRVTVVLGANATQHRNTIANLAVDLIDNPNWESGMGSSLKTGLSHILSSSPAISGLIVMTCDQPAVTVAYLASLVESYIQDRKSIVASYYSGAPGVPALFDSKLFGELLVMDDTHGAKKIILKHSADTILVDFPLGSVDLDTPDDYIRYINAYK